MTVSVPVVVQGVTYTSSNLVYVIDANRAFIQTTSGDGGVQSGDVRKQLQNSYSNANLNSAAVYYGQGYEYTNSSVSGNDSLVMEWTGNDSSGFAVGQSYQDDNGNYKAGFANGASLAVTFDSANPGRASFSPPGSGDSYTMYFFDNNSAFITDFNGGGSPNYLETGWMEPQTQTIFTNAALGGDYLIGPMPMMSVSQIVQIGETNLSTTSNSAFSGELSAGGAGVFAFDQPFSGLTYAWDTTESGTGTFLIPSAGMSCAVINSTKAVCTNQTDFPSINFLQQ